VRMSGAAGKQRNCEGDKECKAKHELHANK
jgi:hypothetical protein